MSFLLFWLLIVGSTSVFSWIVFAYFIPNSARGQIFLVFLGLASAGTTVGIISGFSRVAVAGDVLAAALGLIGGVVVWLFAADQSKGAIVSVCTLVFSASLFVSYMESASRRSSPDSYYYWREKCISIYTEGKIINDPAVFALVEGTVGFMCAKILKQEANSLVR